MSGHTEHTTDEQESQRLIEETVNLTKKISSEVTSAIRKKAQGHDVNFSSIFDQVRNLLDGLKQQLVPASQGPTLSTPIDLMNTYWDRMAQRKERATTGLASLNRALSGGLEGDRLIVLLGAPGSGKTTLVNQIANHVADSQRPVFYVTSEDLPHTLLAKTIARRGNISYTDVQNGNPYEKARINEAFRDYAQQPSAQFLLYADGTSGITLDQIYTQAKAHFSARQSQSAGSPLLIVDYLQRLARGENLGPDLRQSITVYTERLRAMACDLHCTVIALCAMNRASGYHAGNSTIASAKESGDIDYTADVIMAIGAQEDEDDSAPGIRPWMLRIDKNRMGTTTYDQHHIYLDWYADRQQFTEADRDCSSDNRGSSTNKRGRR